MTYLYVKQLHIATVVVTYALFVLRGIWMILDSPQLEKRWVRIAPHVNDTILLAAGIYLATYHGLPAWLVTKIVLLFVYIGLGMVAMQRRRNIQGGRSKSARIAAWIAAQCVIAYMVAVAVTRNPLPFMA